MKRLLAFVLAFVMVLGVCLLAGCNRPAETTTKKQPTATTTAAPKPTETTSGGDVTPGETTTSGGDVTPGETTTSGGDVTPGETTDSSEQGGTVGGEDDLANWKGTTKLPGYLDVDFRGATFTIAAYKDAEDGFDTYREVYSDETDAIAVAVRERNGYIERLYNCTIAIYPTNDPGTIAATDVTANTKTFDLYSQKYAVGYTSTNYYNLYSIPNIDLTADWWNQEYVNTYTMKNGSGANTLLTIVGDFAFSSYGNTHALMFNEKSYRNAIENDLPYENIYDLVRNNKWTMDVFYDMFTHYGKDTSGDSVINYDDGDLVGWATTQHAPHGLHVASGLKIIEVNNGKYEFAMSRDAAQWNTVISKAIEMTKTSDAHGQIGYSKGEEGIVSGKVLFYSDLIAHLEGDAFKNATELEVGVLPYPKYSESQENYAHYVDNHLTSYIVPVSVTDLEAIGNFFTIYAAHSTAQVRDVWFKSYALEYCGSADAAEMLRIVIDTRTFDPGYLIWGNDLEGDLTTMVNNGKNNVTRFIGGAASTAADLIANRITALDKNKT